MLFFCKSDHCPFKINGETIRPSSLVTAWPRIVNRQWSGPVIHRSHQLCVKWKRQELVSLEAKGLWQLAQAGHGQGCAGEWAAAQTLLAAGAGWGPGLSGSAHGWTRPTEVAESFSRKFLLLLSKELVLCLWESCQVASYLSLVTVPSRGCSSGEPGGEGRHATVGPLLKGLLWASIKQPNLRLPLPQRTALQVLNAMWFPSIPVWK